MYQELFYLCTLAVFADTIADSVVSVELKTPAALGQTTNKHMQQQHVQPFLIALYLVKISWASLSNPSCSYNKPSRFSMCGSLGWRDTYFEALSRACSMLWWAVALSAPEEDRMIAGSTVVSVWHTQWAWPAAASDCGDSWSSSSMTLNTTTLTWYCISDACRKRSIASSGWASSATSAWPIHPRTQWGSLDWAFWNDLCASLTTMRSKG